MASLACLTRPKLIDMAYLLVGGVKYDQNSQRVRLFGRPDVYATHVMSLRHIRASTGILETNADTNVCIADSWKRTTCAC
ncbi:hypothetical protein ED733_007541 [Metarhizium rileyi]|uniref:Uncharacterized protein n=1 Tax=Metarhizium rileyi (strain RCEF 4871) TaxID=1649241 RepID=A0A5C6GDP9_METRR|nr:hypothetical protein ED733_007541 [Metarhizium rileyi]